jgi:Outer membrane protein beta-barrel domain
MRNTVLAVLAMAVASLASADELREPRLQVAVLGGVSRFRGGSPPSPLRPAVPFQPDADSPTFAGSLSLRLLPPLALEAEVARAGGRVENGLDTPNNVFLGGGLQLRWPLGAGRVVPYVSAGGGIVKRHARDAFQRTVEQAFDVDDTDPQGYARGGLEWRLSHLIGLRGEYRYFRVFARDAQVLGASRGAYGVHRVAGGLSLSF